MVVFIGLISSKKDDWLIDGIGEHRPVVICALVTIGNNEINLPKRLQSPLDNARGIYNDSMIPLKRTRFDGKSLLGVRLVLQLPFPGEDASVTKKQAIEDRRTIRGFYMRCMRV